MALLNYITNHHCTCVQINQLGVMIEGGPGTGKTSLALSLIESANYKNISGKFICDDQALLHINGDSLWATAPPTTAGQVEVYGFGIVKVDNLETTRIDLVCKLIPQNNISRMPDILTCKRQGIEINYIQCPIQHETQSVRILVQKLASISSIK